MSGNDIRGMTREQYRQYLDEDYFLVKCRLCGEEMLYPKIYNKEELIGYECPTCTRKLRTLGKII